MWPMFTFKHPLLKKHCIRDVSQGKKMRSYGTIACARIMFMVFEWRQRSHRLYIKTIPVRILKDAMSDFWPQTLKSIDFFEWMVFQRVSPALTKKGLTFTFNGQEPCQKCKTFLIGCVRLAPLGQPRCVAVFVFQDERVQIITHVRPGKKPRHTPG